MKKDLQKKALDTAVDLTSRFGLYDLKFDLLEKHSDLAMELAKEQGHSLSPEELDQLAKRAILLGKLRNADKKYCK